MKKYHVTYVETRFEVYEIEAESQEEAEDNYLDGVMIKSGGEDGNMQSIKEIK